MGFLQDMLKEVPLSAVLKERVALADQQKEVVEKRNVELERENQTLRQRVAKLEQENAGLRQVAQSATNDGDLEDDTVRVLQALSRASNPDNTDARVLAGALNMAVGTVEYHLGELYRRGYAGPGGGNYLSGHTFHCLTHAGRTHVVRAKLA